MRIQIYFDPLCLLQVGSSVVDSYKPWRYCEA